MTEKSENIIEELTEEEHFQTNDLNFYLIRMMLPFNSETRLNIYKNLSFLVVIIIYKILFYIECIAKYLLSFFTKIHP